MTTSQTSMSQVGWPRPALGSGLHAICCVSMSVPLAHVHLTPRHRGHVHCLLSAYAAPADPNKTLGIKLPFLVMIIKNLKKYFSFEVQVLDDKNVRRRFRASNYQVWLL